MYQVAEFIVDRSIRPVAVIWTFKEKKQSQCYWPKRDVINKLKKRVPPPLIRNSKSWDILEIKLLLNGKVFDNLPSAEEASEKIAAVSRKSISSNNSSTPRSTDSFWTSEVSSSTEKSSSSLSSSAVNSSTDKSSTPETSSAEKLPYLNDVLSSKKSSISDNNIFKVIQIKSVNAFKDHELYWVNENNMKDYANYWLEEEETDETKFITKMVFNTFEEEFFFNNVSFEKNEEKLSLADSNTLRCWIYIVGKKFGHKIIFEKIVASMSKIHNIKDSANYPNDMSEIQLLESVAAKDLKSAVIDVDLHFPIRSPERYKMVEVLLLQQSNIDIVADNWILICQNKINLFVQQMIVKTFGENFLFKKTTFKVGEKKRELLEGSNIMKLWTVTVQKKFPNEEVSEAVVKKHYQTYKNTVCKSANSGK